MGAFEIAHPLFSISIQADAMECGMRNQGQPHDRLWPLPPKGTTNQPRHLSCLVKGAIVIVLVLSRLQRCSDLCRYWLFAPKEQPHISPGQKWRQPPSDALGFDHPRPAVEVNLSPSKRRSTEDPASIRTSPRAVGCGLVHLPASWLTTGSAAGCWGAGQNPGGACSAPGCYVAAPTERLEQYGMVLMSVGTKPMSS